MVKVAANDKKDVVQKYSSEQKQLEREILRKRGNIGGLFKKQKREKFDFQAINILYGYNLAKRTIIAAQEAIIELLGKNIELLMKTNAPDGEITNAKSTLARLEQSLESVKQVEPQKTDVTRPLQDGPRGFKRIAGMDSIKQELMDNILEPIMHPQEYLEYGIEPLNGFLLYGPPGCGKTLIMESIGDELGRPYFIISPSTVSSKYVGDGIKEIARTFEEARKNAPSIVFIDEIESIAPDRSILDGSGSASVEFNREVDQLLCEFNNSREDDILIICSSNEPQKIDRAIKRTGRLDRKIFIPPPDFPSRKELIERQLVKIKRKDENIPISIIALSTQNYTAEDIRVLIREAALSAKKEGRNVSINHIIEATKKIPASLSDEIVDQYRQKNEF